MEECGGKMRVIWLVTKVIFKILMGLDISKAKQWMLGAVGYESYNPQGQWNLKLHKGKCLYRKYSLKNLKQIEQQQCLALSPPKHESTYFFYFFSMSLLNEQGYVKWRNISSVFRFSYVMNRNVWEGWVGAINSNITPILLNYVEADI